MNSQNEYIPTFEHKNLFLEDSIGKNYFPYLVGNSWDRVSKHFESMGEAGALATPLSAQADLYSPRLLNFDSAGRRIDMVQQDLSYTELKKLSYGRGIVQIKYDQNFLAKNKDIRHRVGFGAGYYFAQSEMGLYCPICMTDGVGRILERHSKSDVSRSTISHLASTDLEQLWEGSMFLTEKRGGSDVGVNETIAINKGGHWYLTGEKWFCSNVAADACLALARMPDGPQGTKGLGLFLILRKDPHGNEKTIRIDRIKDKLGVRSMPTGEVSLNQTEAFLIGGVGEGFKQMAEMLNLSRLYNSVAAIAAMRRALKEASLYGTKRQAFGQNLNRLPLWREGMSDLAAEFIGHMSLTFEAVRTLDEADCGNDESRRLVRLLIPVAKALTGKQSVFTVSECMEAIGGNGYIEESILPRLLRDAQVLPIWEGTTNILALDSVRAVQKEEAHLVLEKKVLSALESGKGNVSRYCDQVKSEMKSAFSFLSGLARESEETQQRASRIWLESIGRLFIKANVISQTSEGRLNSVAMATLDRLYARKYGTTPLCTEFRQQPAEITGDVLIQSIL